MGRPPPGSGNGQLNQCGGIAVDAAGNVYVDDIDNQRIEKFTDAGVYLSQWPIPGSGHLPIDVAGHLWHAENMARRVAEYTTNGVLLAHWGTQGSGDGQFSWPPGIGVDAAGNVYVADDLNDRVQKFTSDGAFLSKWGSTGNGDGQLSGPDGLATDATGNVYVADTNNSRIRKVGAVLGTLAINFDTDPLGAPIANGAVVNNAYALWGVRFEKVGPGTACGSGRNAYASGDQPAGFGSASRLLRLQPELLRDGPRPAREPGLHRRHRRAARRPR